MNRRSSQFVGAIMATASCTLLATSAHATLSSVTSASFGPAQVTFSEDPVGTSIDGLTINGFTFSETVTGNTLIYNTGPGDTNHVTQPSAQSINNPAGEILTIKMPGLTSDFGFGYSLECCGINGGGTVTNAVTITLFDGATNLGSLGYTGTNDPTYPGGFAGIGSTIACDSAELVFSSRALAFDFDNIVANAAPTGTPEPITLSIFGAGLVGALAMRRRKAKRA